jgi:hypothetical protein
MRLIRAACLTTLATLALTAPQLSGPALASKGSMSANASARGYSIGSYANWPDGSRHPMRWNPCRDAISFMVNVKALSRADRAHAVKETKVKVREVARYSGLRFAYKGETTFVPRSYNKDNQPAELVIAFVRPSQTDHPIGPWTVGFGGTGTEWVKDAARVSAEVVSGYVVIDATHTKRWSKSLSRGGVTRPNLIAHELGHAMGLDHVNDRRQRMYPTINKKSPHGFAAGDRAGLAAVGAPAGCVPSFDPMEMFG